jgi:hypothetical protein
MTQVNDNLKGNESAYYENLQEKLIISNKLKRKIPLGQFSLTGKISSLKMNDSIQFESSLERDYIELLEFNKEVESYYEQPFKIYYFKNNTQKHYTPDFLVKYWSGKTELIEIKYTRDLEENRKEYASKFNAATDFCKANNMSFKILTEKEIRTDHLFNAKFITNYRHPKYGFNFDETYVITEILSDYSRITIQQLLDIVSKDIWRQAEILYVLWVAIANHLVYCDFSKKLSMNTIIYLP